MIWDYFNIYRRGSPPLFCFGYTITRVSGSALLCLEDTDKLECFWMSEASPVAARIPTIIGRTMQESQASTSAADRGGGRPVLGGVMGCWVQEGRVVKPSPEDWQDGTHQIGANIDLV